MKKRQKKMTRQQVREELENHLKKFLDLRSTYPRDADEFRIIAGDKEADKYYMAMLQLEGIAQKYGYVMDYWFDKELGQWKYSIVEDPEPCPSAILK